MNRIFTILLAALTFFFGVDIATSTLESFDGDAEQVATYFKDNIYVLNYIDEEAGFAGDISGIEKIQKVQVNDFESNYDAYLCDFNGEEGYMLLADDYILLDYVRDAKSPFEGITSLEYFYSVITGYMYKDGTGKTLSVQNDNNNYEDLTSGANNYSGITDTTSYIKNKYDSKYTLTRNQSTTYKPRYTQEDLTIYYKNGKPAEANCGVVAVYNLFQCLKGVGILNALPSQYATKTVNVYQNENEVVRYHLDVLGQNINGQSGYVEMPSLYHDVRHEASQNLYTIENLTSSQVSALMDDVATHYGYSVCTGNTTEWTSAAITVCNQLDHLVPSIFRASITNLGNHSMTVVGYRTYTKTVKVLWMTQTKTVTLFEVCDGSRRNQTTYFDISAYTGAGAIQLIWTD